MLIDCTRTGMMGMSKTYTLQVRYADQGHEVVGMWSPTPGKKDIFDLRGTTFTIALGEALNWERKPEYCLPDTYDYNPSLVGTFSGGKVTDIRLVGKRRNAETEDWKNTGTGSDEWAMEKVVTKLEDKDEECQMEMITEADSEVKWS